MPLLFLRIPKPVLHFCLMCFAFGVPAAASNTALPLNPPELVLIRPANQSGDTGSSDREFRGFFIERDGFIVTSYTGLVNPESNLIYPRVEVIYPDEKGSRVDTATVVGVEPTLGFGILKVDTDLPLPEAVLASRESLAVGDPIYVAELVDASGNQRFIKGVLKSMNSKECYQESLSETMYKVDLQLSDTMQGSPVFNQEGEVVAMYSGYVKSEDSEVSQCTGCEYTYLLPVHLIQNIYDSLQFKKSFKSPWTGFAVRPLTKEEQVIFPFENEFYGGIGIDYVWENSPAARLGIQVDDILVRFGYYPIHAEADFQKWLYMCGVEHKVKIVLLRDKTEIVEVEYVIEERPTWAKPR